MRQEYRRTHDLKRIIQILAKPENNISLHQSFKNLIKKRRSTYSLQPSMRKKSQRMVDIEQPTTRGITPATKRKPSPKRTPRTLLPPEPERKPSPKRTPRTKRISTIKKSPIRVQLISSLKSPKVRKTQHSLLRLPSLENPVPLSVAHEPTISSFFLPGKKSDCFAVDYNRTKNTLYVKTILWFQNYKVCFGNKVSLNEIVNFLKETADRLDCRKIYLDDQSYIPIPALTMRMVNDFNNNRARDHHPPFFKVLNTLSEGQTLYMKAGFFCLPKTFLANIEILLQNFPEQRDRIIQNTLRFNQAFSSIVLDCVNSLTIEQILPSIPLPTHLSPHSSLREFASWIKKEFQDHLIKNKDPRELWMIYDELSKATFYHNHLFYISSEEGGKAFYPEYLKLVCPVLSLPYNFDWEMTFIHSDLHLRRPLIQDKYGVLRQMLWSLSSSFSETAMYKLSDGNWSSFKLN